MKRSVALALLPMLACCASYADRQAQIPWLVLQSDKDPTELSGCIAPKLRDYMPMLTAAPEGNSTVYALPSPPSNAILGTITISPSGTGSAASLRSFSKTGYFKRAAADIEACR